MPTAGLEVEGCRSEHLLPDTLRRVTLSIQYFLFNVPLSKPGKPRYIIHESNIKYIKAIRNQFSEHRARIHRSTPWSATATLFAKMRAGQFFGKEDIRVVDVLEPKPKSREVIVDVEWCGICGSDLHEYILGNCCSYENGKVTSETY